MAQADGGTTGYGRGLRGGGAPPGCAGQLRPEADGSTTCGHRGPCVAGHLGVAALSTGWRDVGIDVAALVHIDAGEDLVHELL